MKKFLKSKIFWVALALQVAGPILVSFGNWANVIQFVSGFGMAYGLFVYHSDHKQEIAFLKEQIMHLHTKHDALHDKIDKGVSE